MQKRLKELIRSARRLARKYGQIGIYEPDDLVQEAMIKLLRKGNEQEPTFGWLAKVVHSVAMDVGRQTAKGKKFVLSESQAVPSVVSEAVDDYTCLGIDAIASAPDFELEVDLTLQVEEMVEKLSEPFKEVLLLFIEGHSYDEIASLTEQKKGTVRSRLHYARRQAKDLLGEVA